MSRNKFRELLAPSLASVRACWPGLVVIQIGAVLLVCAYYFSPAFQRWCQAASELKQQGGWIFAALSCVVANGILPELIKLAMPGQPRPTPARLVHQFALFAILGVLVDRFYQLQTFLFGAQVNPQILAAKILLDQFGYTMLVVTPFVVVWYLWQENAYSFKSTLGTLSFELVSRRGLQLFAGNLCFWVPSLLALYCLPTELQFLLCLVLGTAWSLLMVFIANRQTAPSTCEAEALG